MGRSLFSHACRDVLALGCSLGIASLALPSVAGADVCPNAALRSGPSAALPDCRAYEQVTPVFKGGAAINTQSISANGETLVGNSLGNFAGVENDPPVIFYANLPSRETGEVLFTREASGWGTTAIVPPASLYSVSFGASLAPSMDSSLWAAVTNAALTATGGDPYDTSLYTRAGKGPLVELGPIPPPGVTPIQEEVRYRGASSDLSHVLFSKSLNHWPGDGTEAGRESLYEYVGPCGGPAECAAAKPLLVGVSGGHGSTALVSNCGTDLGWGGSFKAPESSWYARNAVSPDGSKVLFTAAACGASPRVDELFARVDNELPDAHTVAISEPSAEDCEACDTGEGVLANAHFLSASQDGSKVFFSTTQPLLGGDGSENIYEYDFEAPVGHRIVRVSGGDSTVSGPVAGLRWPLAFSQDGSHVYFVASGVLTATPNSAGERAQGADAFNLYLYERDARYPAGRTAFVGGLAPSDEKPLNQNSGLSSELAATSSSGRFLLFRSSARLTPDDTSGPLAPQLFEYDALLGTLVRASVGQNGFNHDGNTSSEEDAPTIRGVPRLESEMSSPTERDRFAVAEDGRAFFQSANPLVPEATGGNIDVYEFRPEAGGGNTYLISSGQDTHDATFDFADSSGTDVYFDTSVSLLPRDQDSLRDTYDARVNGGFPEPPPPVECSSDGCQGPLASAPVALSPGSEFQAGGNPPLAESKPAAKVKPKAKRKVKKRRARKSRAKRSSRKTRATRRGRGR